MIWIEFINENYLWFLLSVPVFILVHLFAMQYIKGKAMVFANLEAIQKVMKKKRRQVRIGGSVSGSDFFTLFRRSMILLVFILAVSGVVLVYTGNTTSSDFVLALDVSSSMGTEDVLPNRMKVAKEGAITFVEGLVGDAEVGVVSFASESYVNFGLSSDFTEVKKVINELEVNVVGGTSIGDAIVTGVNVLKEGDKFKVIVLLTDGRNNAGVSVDSAIDYALENHVVVHTIGFGGLGNLSGLVSSLDENSLMNISSLTGGEYYRAYGAEDLDRVYLEVLGVKEGKIQLKLAPILLILGLILLFVEWILLSTAYKVVTG